jgi:hypothetical protein
LDDMELPVWLNDAGAARPTASLLGQCAPFPIDTFYRTDYRAV